MAELDRHRQHSRRVLRYNPDSPAEGQWLPLRQISESDDFWGLNPAMILARNGELFYTGSHVSGNNVTQSARRAPNGAGRCWLHQHR